MPSILDVPPDQLICPPEIDTEFEKLWEKAEKIREAAGEELRIARKANVKLSEGEVISTGKGIFACMSAALTALGIAFAIKDLIDVITDTTTRQPRKTRRRRHGNKCVLLAIEELEALQASLTTSKGVSLTERHALVTDDTEKRKRRTFRSRA